MSIIVSKVFTPITVSFKLESKEQVEAFYAMFNYSPNANWLKERLDISIKEVLDHLYSNTPNFNYQPTFSEYFNHIEKRKLS